MLFRGWVGVAGLFGIDRPGFVQGCPVTPYLGEVWCLTGQGQPMQCLAQCAGGFIGDRERISALPGFPQAIRRHPAGKRGAGTPYGSRAR